MLKMGNNASNGIKTVGHDGQVLLFYYSTAATSTLNKCMRKTTTTTTTISRRRSPSPSPGPVFVNYLISLGLSRQEADPISTELAHAWQNKKRSKDDSACSWEFARIWRNRGAKTVSDFNFVANADSVVCFLEHNGFGESHIRELTLHAPKILVSKVNPTLKPKVQAFLNFGLSPTDLVNLVHRITPSSSLFNAGCKSTIVPSLQLFQEVMGSTKGLIYFLDNCVCFRYASFRSFSKAFSAM